MAETPRITLLAFLIALAQLQTSLTPDEKEALKKTASQLYFDFDPDNWNLIKEGLVATIRANSVLYQNYQTALVQLQLVNGNIPLEQMPTQNELETELTVNNHEPVTYGYFRGEPERESDEIRNVTIHVLTSQKPDEAAKKLSFLNRLQNWLLKPQSP